MVIIIITIIIIIIIIIIILLGYWKWDSHNMVKCRWNFSQNNYA